MQVRYQLFLSIFSLSVSRISRAILIARSSLSLLPSSLCKNFKTQKLNTCIAHYDKILLQDKGQKSDSYIFGVMPLFN